MRSFPCVTPSMFAARRWTTAAAGLLAMIAACREIRLPAAPPTAQAAEEQIPWTNADFELGDENANRPAGWRHLRQAQRAPTPDGTGHCLYFHNSVPGRESQAQRTIKVSPDAAGARLSASVKLAGVAPGQASYQRPQVFVAFENEAGERLSTATLGLWMGTCEWTHYERVVEVPPGTCTASMWIGLAGAVGEAWFDDVELKAAELNRSVLPK